MDKWQIQQRINSLNYQKDELEKDINVLNGKKKRINLEIERKNRQDAQACDYYMNKRKAATNLRAEVHGCAMNTILQKFQDIYGVDVERNVTDNLGEVAGYLKLNCEEIDEDILKIQGRIATLNNQICELYKELYSSDKEEVM